MVRKGSNLPFRGQRGKVRKRRILVAARRPGEGLLTEPTADARPWQREPLTFADLDLRRRDPDHRTQSMLARRGRRLYPIRRSAASATSFTRPNRHYLDRRRRRELTRGERHVDPGGSGEVRAAIWMRGVSG